MSKEEKIEQLELFKQKDKFKLDDWEDRDLEIPSLAIVLAMRQEVNRFADYLIAQLKADVTNMQTKVQLYFNAWDNDLFDQDQTEFIVEVEFEAMRIVGVNIDKLMI